MLRTKEYTISLTEDQAKALEATCAAREATRPESLIAAWIADKLDLIKVGPDE
jgi:hypothetical protein